MTNRTRESENPEIGAVFNRLREEIVGRPQSSQPDHSKAEGGPPTIARQDAERFSAVTADRPFLYKPGRWGRIRGLLLLPLKSVLRKLMRWYIEPLATDQRAFNAAIVRAVDDLGVWTAGEVARLERRIEDLERRGESGA
jgi:hypothetical protein